MSGVPMNSVEFKTVTAPILNVAFDGIYEQRKDEYKAIFTEKSGTPRRYHEEPVLFGFGAAPEIPDGQAITYNQGGTLFIKRYFYKIYGLAFALTRTLVEDGEHISVGKVYSEHLAQSIYETKEINAANIINRAFNSSFQGGDGVSLANSAHPSRVGTYSNLLSSAAALSQTSLEAMLIQIRQAADDTGRKISLQPQKLTVSPANIMTATVLLRSVLRAGTANNDINPIKSSAMLEDSPVVMSRLTSNTIWGVKTDAPRGLQVLTRTGIKKEMQGDFETDSVRYKATERYDLGWTNPRGIYLSAGA